MIKYVNNEDKNFYVTDEVSSVPTDESNTSWENRYKFVTDLAAISRGKYESGNPEKRFKHLLKEASCNITIDQLEDVTDKDYFNRHYYSSASRPLEFLPVVLKFCKTNMNTYMVLLNNGEELHVQDLNFFRHCYVSETVEDGEFKYRLYTNFRNIYNWMLQNHVTYPNEDAIDMIPFNNKDELQDFKAIRVSSPMFVWSQLMTHTQISKESQSDRVSSNNGYWLPDDIMDRISSMDVNDIDVAEIKHFIDGFKTGFLNNEDTYKTQHDFLMNIFLNVLPQNKIQDLLKQLGYQREIYSRAPYYFKYKELIMTGWANDPKTWGHLLLEREAYPDYHTSWVQKETADTVKAIREVLINA